MDKSPKEDYTQDEVTAIIRRALLMHDLSDTVTQNDLEDIAQQTGISRERLQRAILEEQRERDLERMKQQIASRKRHDFHVHLRAWLIVSTGWFLLNLTVVLAGVLMAEFALFSFGAPVVMWGVIVALHASSAFFQHDAALEKEARKLLWREECKRAAMSWGEKALSFLDRRDRYDRFDR